MTSFLRCGILAVSGLVLAAAAAAAAVGCTGRDEGGKKLIFAGYTTPREAYAEIIQRFIEKWKREAGEAIRFEESYVASGAQSRAIVQGFEADVAALSLDPDIDRIAKAGLITSDWRSGKHHGFVTRSVVAFAVRPGNPKGVRDWKDLARPGIEVLTPNPKTSGGAMWNVLGLYGAALRGKVEGVEAGDEAGAFVLLKAVLKNVSAMDKGARESMINFEKGVGDVAITYENEVLVGLAQGEKYDLVIPSSTILIENPVAVIDVHANKHGVGKAAAAFVEFLFSKEAQEIFAKHGLRAADEEVLEATAARYPPVPDLFTVRDLGGFKEATARIFGETGVFSRAIAEVYGP